MSELVRKSQKCRNNEKSFMITKLLHDLQNSIDETERYSSVSNFVEIEVRDSVGDLLSAVKGDDIGCLNVDCEFLKFQKIFYSNMKFFCLPTVPGKLHCIVCDRIMSGELRRSEINILSNGSIKISKK